MMYAVQRHRNGAWEFIFPQPLQSLVAATSVAEAHSRDGYANCMRCRVVEASIDTHGDSTLEVVAGRVLAIFEAGHPAYVVSCRVPATIVIAEIGAAGWVWLGGMFEPVAQQESTGNYSGENSNAGQEQAQVPIKTRALRRIVIAEQEAGKE